MQRMSPGPVLMMSVGRCRSLSTYHQCSPSKDQSVEALEMQRPGTLKLCTFQAAATGLTCPTWQLSPMQLGSMYRCSLSIQASHLCGVLRSTLPYKELLATQLSWWICWQQAMGSHRHEVLKSNPSDMKSCSYPLD